MSKRLYPFVAASLFLSFLFVDSVPAETPQSGGTLTILYARAVVSLDPHRDAGAGGIPILNHILESMVGTDDHGAIIPMLATAMPEVSGDGLEYTFALRKGVKFHDGTDFTAEAVKFTFERILNPDVSTQSRRVGEFIEGVSVLDPYKVKIRLKRPWADFLTMMAEDKVFDIIHPESVKKLGKDFGVTGIVGTGPFKFVEWKKGATVVLEKNRHYWKNDLPYLDKIVWREIPEDATRLLGFLSGEGDVLLQVSFKDVADLKKKKGVKILEQASGEHVGIWFNTRKAPVNDKRVRQALSMALDRKAVMDSVFYGLGTTSKSYLPPFFKEYQGVRDPYDLKEAQRLMEACGYTRSNPLKFELMYRAEEAFQDVATLVQAMWAQVNVKVDLKPITGTGIQQAIMGDDPPYTAMCMRITGGMPIFDHAYRVYSSASYWNAMGYNKKGGYQNPRADELLTKAAAEVDKEKAKKIYRDLTEILFYEDVPIAYIGAPSNVDVVYDHVRGWVPDEIDYSTHARVWLSKKK
jgi:peptide/nickel transport system substrate-binding protein